MDAASLHNILLHTFSNDEAARKAAEEAVANLHSVRGAVLLLVQIAVEASVAREIRQAAAVSLKNLVHKYWEGAEGADGQWLHVFPDDEKHAARQSALEALLVSQDNSIRQLLAETVSYIARFDFPEQWPSLIDDICKNTQSGDANRIINVRPTPLLFPAVLGIDTHAACYLLLVMLSLQALLALRRVVKNFEYRSEDVRLLLSV
jgi:hypothetical protein